MTKLHLLLLAILLCLIFNCGVTHNTNRYTSYEIFPSLKLNDSSSSTINELKFEPYYNPTDAQRLMFQKFGKWNNTIYIDRAYPLLVWSDIKLFSWSDDLYTVGVSGENTELSKYCSALVFNSKNEDCLLKHSKIRDSIVNFFIKGTEQTVKSDKKFKKEFKTLLKQKNQIH